jgi:hypothetical protein
MSEKSNEEVFGGRVRHFAEILNPLFDTDLFMTSDKLFEFVCVLVRPAGIQGPEWDPWHESQAMLGDLGNLGELELPSTLFHDPARTRIRLSLLSYCHVTEMDLPYVLVVNLLRVRLGKKYAINPFGDLATPIKKKGILQKLIPPSPGKKIKRIKELAEEAKLPEVGTAFESIHDSIIRNAVAHSDYTLADGEFRLLKDHRKSKTKGYLSQVVTWEELTELFTDTFAFYTALYSLYDRCTRSFGDFGNAFMPYDGHYKAILQLILDPEQQLIGFRAYWPNNSLSEWSRTKKGCGGVNLEFDPDGSVNFFVGLYASKPSKFSPLVEDGDQASYAQIPGFSSRPHWPEDLKCYKLPLAEKQMRRHRRTNDRANFHACKGFWEKVREIDRPSRQHAVRELPI